MNSGVPGPSAHPGRELGLSPLHTAQPVSCFQGLREQARWPLSALQA